MMSNSTKTDITPGLGWPRMVIHQRDLGWPGVSRETVVVPEAAACPQEAAGAEEYSSIRSARAADGVSRHDIGRDHAADVEPSPASAVLGEQRPEDHHVKSEDHAARRIDHLPRDGVSDSAASPGAMGEERASTVAVLEREAAPPVTLHVEGHIHPGPRRARFDEPEFPVVPAEVDVVSVPRETPNVALPKPARTRVIVVANQKGGVGKTTTSVNLAAALAQGGLTVTVLDLDPQGNASTALGVDHGPGTPGTYEVLISGEPIADHLVDSPEAPNLRVLPATIDLAGAEIELVSVVARENRLLRAIKSYLQDSPVDYIFLDCPPSLGLLTLNALVAANEILIPIQCEYYALEGVSQLMRTINLVKGELNDSLKVSTVLLTMFDARTRLAAQVADEVRSYFAAETLPVVIPRSVRISEAPSYGQTVLTYHPESAGAVSYRDAAHEIARRGAKEPA